MKNKYYSLFLLVPLFIIISAKNTSADFDPQNIKEVILVRGSIMPVCPFDGYDDTTKARINDSVPYYDMNEFDKLHPSPMNPANKNGCSELLYGQIELVPFGKEPTYIPTEYLYIFNNTIIREVNVLVTESKQFSDERTMYKKVLKFSGIDPETGEDVLLPNTVFWFRGNEVYGKISDIMEGVIEYKGTYYRHDGAQTFINNAVLWGNPESGPAITDPTVYEASVSSVPMPKINEPLPYPTPIQWKDAVFSYGKEENGIIYPGDMAQPGLPLDIASRFVGYRLELPEGLASTAGLIARFRTCANDACTQSYSQAIYIADKDGNLLSHTYSWDKNEKLVDLNTDYFRTYRAIYLVFGTSQVPTAEGIKFKYFFGNITNAPAAGISN